MTKTVGAAVHIFGTGKLKHAALANMLHFEIDAAVAVSVKKCQKNLISICSLQTPTPKQVILINYIIFVYWVH